MPNLQLLLQTALRKSNLSLFQDGQILASLSTLLDHRSENTYVEDIRSMLENNKLKAAMLDEVFLVHGPGFFTGIRSGTMICKAFFQQIRAKFFLISSFDYLAQGIREKPCEYGILISSTKREGYYKKMTNNPEQNDAIMIEYSQMKTVSTQLPVYTENKSLALEYSFHWIDVQPWLPDQFNEVNRLEDIAPNYVRSEEDLFQP